ncbi:unnamed protein product [Adineta ricciae]|uniref:Uncharacterized protein n=1 Tax=Adineta ricciae TaxID=249248 RepID=A0A815A2D5_ADIRI|nr:unnamed protein product [Adineta ricciae]CAF1251364.1 unnamed protein product [Adineta ricciae]
MNITGLFLFKFTLKIIHVCIHAILSEDSKFQASQRETGYTDQQDQVSHRFDPVEIQSAFGLKTYEIYQDDPPVGNTGLIDTEYGSYTLIDSREHISLVNSACQLAADDGLNVHGTYFLVSKVIDPTTIIPQTKVGDVGQLDVETETRLQFSTSHNSHLLSMASPLWYEGPIVYNITLTENVYINCNEGNGQLSFINVIDSRTILYAGNIDQLLFMNNYIAKNVPISLISICNSRSLTAMNNTRKTN